MKVLLCILCQSKATLCSNRFAEIWENQEVDNGAKFIQLLEQRLIWTFVRRHVMKIFN